MTVSSVIPVNNYTGNNSSTTFDFDFYIDSSSELTVTLINSNGNETTLVLNQDYSINEVGNTEGSYITFPLASSSHSVLSTDEKISLALTLDIEQETEFPACENLDLPTLEKTFDYLTRLIQILNRKTDRAVKIQEGSGINVDTLVQNVNKIATDISNVNSVAADLTNIDAVKADLTNVDTVSANISNVNTVAGISANVSAVAGNATNINAVNANKTNIDTVATDISGINSVAADLNNIDAVKADLTNVDTVSANISNINTVAAISANVSAVSGNSANITTVATNNTNINTCATNISSITSASGYATTATQQATVATQKADLAKDWASKASTPVEGSLYSAKYYAEQAQQQGGTTYAVVRASKSYADAGELLTDTEGLADVTSYAHSTYDSSKFTVVGSPTITDDGIFTKGSSNTSDYLSLSFDNTSTQWVVNMIFTYNAGAARFVGSTSDAFQIYVSNWGVETTVYNSVSGNVSIPKPVNSSTAFVSGGKYQMYFQYVDGAYKIGYMRLDTTDTWHTSSVTSSILPGKSTLTILKQTNSNTSFEIDLKQFFITNNGAPYFSGNKTGTDTYTIDGSTVSIPYTLSKTGSKIVDSYYRTQVTSVYNAFGYAPYYTLNEGTNFTLPMGEVYGFIGKNDIIEYINGTSGYRIWVKTGFCEQWGTWNGTIGNCDIKTVTLLKTYKDTSYNVLIVGSPADYMLGGYAWTTNSFRHQARYYDDDSGSQTSSAAVNWKTSGYLADGQW